jgi:5-methylcytosine-specific restriction endonuclease McrA
MGWKKWVKRIMKPLPKKAFRSAVFERDDYTCQMKKTDGTICGWQGVRSLTQDQKVRHLTVHHINHNSHDHRFDLDRDDLIKNNGITACNQCHTAFHRREDHRRKFPPEKTS